MWSALVEHKGKLLVGVTALGGSVYLYRQYIKLRGQEPQSNLLGSLMNEKTATDEQKRKDKLYQTLLMRMQQKVANNVVFVAYQVDQLFRVGQLKEAASSGLNLATSAELRTTLAFTFSSLLLSRFFHLLQIVYTSIHFKQGVRLQPVSQPPAPLPSTKDTPEETKEMLKKMPKEPEETKGPPKLSEPASGSLVSAAKDDPNMFLQFVLVYFQEIAEEMRTHFESALAGLGTQMTNVECAQLLPRVYGYFKVKFGQLVCAPGSDPLDLVSYSILAVHKFEMILKKQRVGHAMYEEIGAFMASVYFQSLLLQGLDLDFHALNGEFQKMVALIFQGKAEGETVNVWEVLAGILKTNEEARKKSEARFRNEVELTHMNNYLEKLFKLLSSHLLSPPAFLFFSFLVLSFRCLLSISPFSGVLPWFDLGFVALLYGTRLLRKLA